MKLYIRLILAALMAALVSLATCSGKKAYPFRWVYVTALLDDDAEVGRIAELARRASTHGLNGFVMFSRFDYLSLQDSVYFRRLAEVKRACDENGIEIIPRCLDLGYNDETNLHHDRNLAEGLPVIDAVFVAAKGRALPVTEPPVVVVNGGFEERVAEKVSGFRALAPLGEVIFRDEMNCREGKASLRFENFGGFPSDSMLLVQEVAVRPNRLYRLSCWVKNEGVKAPEEGFPLRTRGADGRRLEYFEPQVPRDGQWRKVSYGFNSLDNNRITVAVGAMGADSGRYWIDDIRIEEPGLVNLLRRSGTPLSVKSAWNGTVYEEGVDFAPVADSVLDFKFDREGPSIELLPGSRIADGEKLAVSFYHGMTIYYHQVVGCLSEPRVYDLWREQVRLLDKYLKPAKYFLSVDELRMAGTCKACTDRGLPLPAMLGDCVSRQEAIIREVNPQAELFIWSDMFDSHHNADRRGHYYLASGDFYGAWEHIPKDLVIACWYHERRRESLGHFSSLGYRTFACGYYDRDDLDNDRTWLEALDQTPGAAGIMYTTWSGKYGLLEDFGDLVSGHPATLLPLSMK